MRDMGEARQGEAGRAAGQTVAGIAVPPDFRPGVRLWLVYLLYQVVAHLAVPLLLLIAFVRSRREPLYRARLGDRFGLSPPAPRGAIWVFAASLGETRAVSPLLRELLARGHHILLTHSSPAGLVEGGRLFGAEIAAGRVFQSYGPIDLHGAMRRFLARQRPVLGLVVESEIWPAQLLAAHRAGVPMAVINGNFTQRALDRDQHGIGRFRLAFLRSFTLILTKSDAHAARYAAAGADPARIHNVGELKFDLPIDDVQRAAAPTARARLWGGRPTFLIASSVEAEEQALFDVLARLRASPAPMPAVIWVPRSPQRFALVAARARAGGWNVACRSEMLDPQFGFAATVPPTPPPDILVGDSLGEMDFYYALADLVFVGATLCDLGGHNIIEPLAQEKPVVTGPSIYGISFPAEEARAAGALRVVADAPALAAEVALLLSDDRALAAFADAARGFNKGHSGAARRSAVLLARVIHG